MSEEKTEFRDDTLQFMLKNWSSFKTSGYFNFLKNFRKTRLTEMDIELSVLLRRYFVISGVEIKFRKYEHKFFDVKSPNEESELLRFIWSMKNSIGEKSLNYYMMSILDIEEEKKGRKHTN